MKVEIEIKTFGQLVVYKRVSMGLTQTQLAKEAGISRTNITNYESGAFMPSVAVLARLAEILEFDGNLALALIRDYYDTKIE